MTRVIEILHNSTFFFIYKVVQQRVMHNFLFIRLYLFLLFIYFFCRIGESPNLLELGWTVGSAAMACIHFKFKNSLDYDSITFDGLHIALRDLKRMIMNRKKLRDTDDDLQIINAITKKGQSDEVQSSGPKKSAFVFLLDYLIYSL